VLFAYSVPMIAFSSTVPVNTISSFFRSQFIHDLSGDGVVDGNIHHCCIS
jgi:hypothetical protein